MQKFAHKNATCVFTEIMNEFSSYNCIGVGAIHCLLSWLWLIAQYSSSSRIKAAVLLIFRINESDVGVNARLFNEWMNEATRRHHHPVNIICSLGFGMNEFLTDGSGPNEPNELHMIKDNNFHVCCHKNLHFSRGHHYVTAQLQRKWLI